MDDVDRFLAEQYHAMSNQPTPTPEELIEMAKAQQQAPPEYFERGNREFYEACSFMQRVKARLEAASRRT